MAGAWYSFEYPEPLVNVQPRVLLGYMMPAASDTMDVVLLDSSSTLRVLKQSAKMEGLWMELVVPVRSVFPIGFTTSLGYLAPPNYRVQESYWNNNLQEAAQRTWQTRTTLYNLKFSIDYTFTPSVTGMLGFMYDSFMSNYFSPENITQSGSYLNFQQTVGFDVSVSTPFAGAMYERTLWSGIDLMAYIIGYPGLPGHLAFQESVEYTIGSSSNGVKLNKEISSGYFYEAFTQLTMPVWRGIGGGAFARYLEYSGKIPGVEMDRMPGKDDYLTSADVSFLRRDFVVGASISALF